MCQSLPGTIFSAFAMVWTCFLAIFLSLLGLIFLSSFSEEVRTPNLQKEATTGNVRVFYYCRTYYKAIRVGGGEWRTCATREQQRDFPAAAAGNFFLFFPRSGRCGKSRSGREIRRKPDPLPAEAAPRFPAAADARFSAAAAVGKKKEKKFPLRDFPHGRCGGKKKIPAAARILIG